MTSNNSRFAAWLGTGAVVAHAIPLLLHSAAHVQLGIYLPSLLANVYIWVVLLAAPVVAAVLLWTTRARLGAWLLVWSMLGSFVFEGYNHFLAMSPDHVSQIPAGTWGDIFKITAVLSLATEILGGVIGLLLVFAPPPTGTNARTPKPGSSALS